MRCVQLLRQCRHLYTVATDCYCRGTGQSAPEEIITHNTVFICLPSSQSAGITPRFRSLNERKKLKIEILISNVISVALKY